VLVRRTAAVAALLATGCLGRSVQEDSARVLVRWVVDPALPCDQQFPRMRVRSVVVPPGPSPVIDPDDEEFDWMPCLSNAGSREGTTAPLPIATYELTVTMHDGLDGLVLAQSDTATVTLVAEAEEIEEVTVSFFLTTTPVEDARAPGPEPRRP
jgi:hypothetical protein